MKRWKGAIFLAIVLTVFTAVSYWDEWKTKQDDEEKKGKDKLFSFSKDDVIKVEYENAPYLNDKDGKPAKFTVEKKDDGKWQIISPVSGSADGMAIDGIIGGLVDYKYEKVISEDKSQWSQYGLDRPQRTIVLTVKNGGEPVTLYLGEKAPVGYSVYLRAGTKETIYLGGQQILTSTSKTLTDIRDKSISGVTLDKVTDVVYKNTGDKEKATIHFAKKDGKYAVVGVDGMASDAQEISEFVSFIVTEKAEDFADNPDKELRAAFSKKPLASVEITEEGGKRTTIQFAEHKDTAWAAFEPSKLAYKLAQAAKAKLNKHVKDFRDKSLVKFDSAQVEQVEIDGTNYTKVAGDWYLTSDAPQVKAEKEQQKQAGGDAKDKDKAPSTPAHKFETKQFVQNLIVDLEFVKASGFYKESDVRASVAAAPKHRIKISFKEDLKKDPIVFDAWEDAASKGKALVRVSGKTEIYQIDANLLENTKERKVPQTQALSEGEDNGNG